MQAKRFTQLTADRLVEGGEGAKGRHAVGGGHGLYLVVRSATSAQWTQRLTVGGRKCDMGLGSARTVRLTDARKEAAERWRIAKNGGDPRPRRAATANGGDGRPTFRECAERVIALKKPHWRETSHTEQQWRQSMADYVYPRFGDKPVADVTRREIADAIAALWNSKPATGRKVRRRIAEVMAWACASEYREDDPSAGKALTILLGKQDRTVRHHPALAPADVPGFLAALQSDCSPVVRLCLSFITLTAVRSAEARAARWAEIDLDARLWTISAERMKAGKEHRVPLSRAAMAVLAEAKTLCDGSGLVFPNPRSERYNILPVISLMRQFHNRGLAGTVHGMRSSFRDWCSESGRVPEHVAELALAHFRSDPTEAAYARSDLLEQRREAMEAWGRHVCPAAYH